MPEMELPFQNHEYCLGTPDIPAAAVFAGPALEALLPNSFLPELRLKERVRELTDRLSARLAGVSLSSSALAFDALSIMRNLDHNTGNLFPPELRVVRTGDPERLTKMAELVAPLQRVTPEIMERFDTLRAAVETGELTLTAQGRKLCGKCLGQMERNPGYLNGKELEFVFNPEQFGSKSSSPQKLPHPERCEPIGRSGLVWGPDGVPYNDFPTSTRRGEPFLTPKTNGAYLQWLLKHPLQDPIAGAHRDMIARRGLQWVEERKEGWEAATASYLLWLEDKFPPSRHCAQK